MFADLTGMTALVTGVGDGLGRSISLVLAQQGANVALTDIKKELVAQTAKEITNAKTIELELDVSKIESVQQAVSQVLENWDHLDILVNNAGLFLGSGRQGHGPGSQGQMQEEDWKAMLDVSLMGVIRCCEAVIPHMKERGYGKIITIASIAGHINRLSVGPYPVTKAAALRYTKSLARPLAAHNINVNAVCPGPTWVPRLERNHRLKQQSDPTLADKDAYQAYLDDYGADLFFDRGISAEDIGNAVAFLASDEARNISGQCLHVDQGRILHD